MTIPVVPVEIDADELALISRCFVHFRARDLTVDTVSGQLGTFTRGATASVNDALGVAFTVGQQLPRFDWRSWLGSSVVGLLMGTTDRLTYECSWRPQAFSFWLRFQMVTTMPTASMTLWSISNDTPNGARVWLDSTGTFFRLRHNNGSTEVTATLAVAPVNTDRVELRGTVFSDGSVQLYQSINEAAETFTARTAANALAAAWGTGAKARLNGAGTGNTTSMFVRDWKLIPSVPDYATTVRVL